MRSRHLIGLLTTGGALLAGTALIASGRAAPTPVHERPDWRPAEICAKGSAQGQCLLFEQRARNDILPAWDVLPDDARRTCLMRFAPPLEPSWRLLADCVESEGRRAWQARVDAKQRQEAVALLAQEIRNRGTQNRSQTAAEISRARQQSDQRMRRLADVAAADRKRVAAEEASFMALLTAQREAEAGDARRKAAEKRLAQARQELEARRLGEAERETRALRALADGRQPQRAADQAAAEEAETQRIRREEESFLARVADQQRQDDQARQRAAEAARSKAAETERRRIADEEASFMRTLEAQREADAAATKAAKLAKDAAARAAAERAVEAERQRVAEEEASFMRLVEEQRRADAEKAAAAKAKAVAARQAERDRQALAERQQREAAEASRKQAALSCQTRLKQVQSNGVMQFGFNSSQLSDQASSALLDRLAQAARDCQGDLAITVEGHTDSVGSAAGNVRLSQARAEAVANYLRSKGVAATRISARGFGAAQPIASNQTRVGRAKNRRIEFKVQ